MAASLIPLSALTTPPDSLLPDYLKRSPVPQGSPPSAPTPQLEPSQQQAALAPTPAPTNETPRSPAEIRKAWAEQAPAGTYPVLAQRGMIQVASPWAAAVEGFAEKFQPPGVTWGEISDWAFHQTPQNDGFRTLTMGSGPVSMGAGAPFVSTPPPGQLSTQETVAGASSTSPPTYGGGLAPQVVPAPAPTPLGGAQAQTPTPGLDAPDKEARKRLFGAIIGTYAGSLQDPNRASADIMLDRALGQLMANGFIPDGVAMGRLEVGGRGTLVAKDAQAQQALDAWRSKVREQFYGYLVGSQQDALRQEETKQQALIALNRAFGTSLTGQPMNGPVWAPGTEPQTYAPQVAGVDAARPGPPNPVALIQAYQAQQDETLRNAAALGAAPNASRGLGATQAALTPSQRNSRMAEIAKFREQVANSTGLTDADRRAAEEWATQQEQEALRGIMPPSPPLADGSIVVEMINPETGMRERGKIKPDEFDPNTMIRV